MKRRIRAKQLGAIVTLIIVASVPVLGAGETDEERVNAGVDETFVEWETAISEGDVDSLADLVADDAVFWTHGAPELKGRAAVREAFTRAFDAWSMKQTFEEHERIIGDGWVFFRGVEHNTLTPKSGEGAPVNVDQRAFGIMKRGEDGRWRFARGMTNLPPSD